MDDGLGNERPDAVLQDDELGGVRPAVDECDLLGGRGRHLGHDPNRPCAVGDQEVSQQQGVGAGGVVFSSGTRRSTGRHASDSESSRALGA